MKYLSMLILFLVGLALGRYGVPLVPAPGAAAIDMKTAAVQNSGESVSEAATILKTTVSEADPRSSPPPAKAGATHGKPIPTLTEVGAVRTFEGRDQMLASLNRDETAALQTAEHIFPGLWNFKDASGYQQLLGEGVPSIEELAWAQERSVSELQTLMEAAHSERNRERGAKLGVMTLMRALQENYQSYEWAPNDKRFLQALRDSGNAVTRAQDSGLRVTGYFKMAAWRLREENEYNKMDGVIGAALASASGDQRFITLKEWPKCDQCSAQEALHAMAVAVQRSKL